MKKTVHILLIFLVIGTLYKCARKGRPSGGPKDETAPLLVTTNPPYKTVNFNKKEIKIYFDEYITLKDLNQQLVVSPPLKNPPLITPQGTPSKHITIKILDTLRPNTTYTFNFGNAIQDNNEGNTLESFKYVFSTGKQIDSLTLKGSIKDAFDKELTQNSSILLYKIDSAFTDSIIYKEKPFYVTNTIDTVNYQFTNLQEGKYLLLALKEENKDYIFNPITDKIAFISNPVFLPKDTVITKKLRLFKELQPYKFKRGKEVKKGKIQFGFQGEREKPIVKILSSVPKDFKSFSQLEKEKDTLNYWFTPFKVDSLLFTITNKNTIDTSKVFLRKKKIDSLTISIAAINNGLHLKDTLFFKANNPIIVVDTIQFSIINKDSVLVPFKLIKKEPTTYGAIFKKEPTNLYKIQVFPNAFTDLYNTKNKDTLLYNLRTKAIEDYGSIVLEVKNKKKNPLIIELLNKNGFVLDSQTTITSKKITFNLLEANQYFIRAIVDENKNNKWDTGNFLKRKQPEPILYFNKELNVRANWIVNETFIVQ